MTTIIFFVILSFFACADKTHRTTQATVVSKAITEECSNLYPFDNYYIDLDNNNAVLIDGIPAIDFKSCSKYAHRFKNTVSESVNLNGYSYIVEKNKDKGIYNIAIFEGETRINTIKLPVENPLPEVHEYYINILPYENDIIMFMEDMYTTHYMVCKYNSKGDELMRKKIEHTFITHPEPETNYYHRYLYFKELTATQIIFTSHIAFAEKDKTIVLSMDDFSVQEYDKTANGIILDEEDQNIAGFVSSEDDKFTVQMLDGSKYHFSIEYGDPACDFILKDSLLYIANYHPIATGSKLCCYDLKAKKMKWTADVKQIMASHSEYCNQVIISMYKDKIVMEGIEAAGSYVQIFDVETGKRLGTFGDFIENEE